LLGSPLLRDSYHRAEAIAYLLTGSVRPALRRLESFVNTRWRADGVGHVTIAARPADEAHVYGHGKAEYFSSGVEGTLILIAP